MELLNLEEDSPKYCQVNELNSLKAIFFDEIVDLNTENVWKPTEVRVHVLPPKTTREPIFNYSLFLYVKCPENYPYVVPYFELQEVKGLSKPQQDKLIIDLKKLAENKYGLVVIFDLVEHIQTFMDVNKKPAFLSFHDEMLSRRQLSEEAELQDRRNKVAEEKENFVNQIKQHEESLKVKQRRPSHREDMTDDKRQSTELPTTSQHNCPNSGSTPKLTYRGERIYCFPCSGHSTSMGSCRRNGILGPHAMAGAKGDVVDKYNVDPVLIRTWRRCLSAADEIIAVADINQARSDIRKLSRICNANIPATSSIHVDSEYVHLIRRFIPGISLQDHIGGGIESSKMARNVARGVLAGLSALHVSGLYHGALRPSCIIISDTFVLVGEVADALLVNLTRMQNGLEKLVAMKESDLVAFSQILSQILPEKMQPQTVDFLEKCGGKDSWSAEQLLKHPWLLSETDTSLSFSDDLEQSSSSDNDTSNRASELIEKIISGQTARSRITEDFNIIKMLGRGAFGNVFKARNKLDGGLYAIKCVQLDLKRPQFCRRITREVKFVSRLCHDHVVRYYNAWLEDQNEEPEESSKAEKLPADSENDSLRLPRDDSEYDWFTFEESGHNESNVVAIQSDSDSEEEETSVVNLKHAFLFIQMELCSKATLRRAIDTQSLHKHPPRAWRLFTEIVSGLAHVHSRGLIHRDLKPGNIFLDVNDRVKIGDFGLATTKINFIQDISSAEPILESKDTAATSLTGQVGTALYAAPELAGRMRIVYNQKVDIYSLGIILFEMFHSNFPTTMERMKVLTELRSPDVIIPEEFLKHANDSIVYLVRWCVSHVADSRPTCSELLESDYLRSKEDSMADLLQPKSIPRIASALAALQPTAAERVVFNAAAGNRAVRRYTSDLEKVQLVCTNVLQQFGARHLSTPLLSPPSLPTSMSNQDDSCVRLVMSSGLPVRLPRDLHTGLSRMAPFSGESALGPVRRYNIDRVYRERAPGLHPQERLQAVFDILTPEQSFPWADAEVLAATYSVLRALNLHTKMYIRIGHTELSASALGAAKVPPEISATWVWSRRSQTVAVSSLSLSFENKRQLASLLNSEVPIEDIHTSRATAALKALTSRRDDAGEKSRSSIAEIQETLECARSLGMEFAVRLAITIPHTQKQSGIIWELVETCGDKFSGGIVACGSRYDALMQREAQSAPHLQHTHLHAVGVSLDLEKLAEFAYDLPEQGKVIIRTPRRIHNAASMSNFAELARVLRAANFSVILLEGDAHITCQPQDVQCTLEGGRWVASCGTDMRNFRIDDAVQLVSAMLKTKYQANVVPSPQRKSSSLMISVTVLSQDHSTSMRRKHEEAASSKARRTLQSHGLTELNGWVHVLAIDCNAQLVRSLVAHLDSIPPKNMDALCELFPRQRKLLMSIGDALSVKPTFGQMSLSGQQMPLYAFFSIRDNICKFLI